MPCFKTSNTLMSYLLSLSFSSHMIISRRFSIIFWIPHLFIVCSLNVRHFMWVFTLTLHSEPICVCGLFPEEETTAPHVRNREGASVGRLHSCPAGSFASCSKTSTSKSLKCSLHGLPLVVCCIRGHPGGCPYYVDVLETQDKDNNPMFKASLLMTFDFENLTQRPAKHVTNPFLSPFCDF